MLASYHNLYFINNLVKNCRNAIEEGRFLQYKKDFLFHYNEGAYEKKEHF
jgi:queuine tRNA-ribosyltransferase